MANTLGMAAQLAGQSLRFGWYLALNRALDWTLPDDEATTIAGLVIHEARSIPEPGQTFTFHGFRFRILRRERNRITALRITPLVRKLLKSA